MKSIEIFKLYIKFYGSKLTMAKFIKMIKKYIVEWALN